jgi:hypothetical protein
MDTPNPQQDMEVTAYYLRGRPGSFTDIVRADAMPAAQESRELRERECGNRVAGYALPARVLPAQRWWEYYAHSAVHSACCDAKARDIVGGEYTLGGDGVGQGTLDMAAEIIERSQETDALNDACRDWEVTGWADLECLPTRGGELHRLNHLDSWTVWPAQNEAAYIHTRDGKYQVYAPLGNKAMGLYQCAHINNNHWYKNTYYGVPDIVSAIIQIETAYSALQYNQNFFAREGGYRWLMLIGTPIGSGYDTTGEGDAKLIRTVNHHFTKSGKESDGDLLSIPIDTRTVTLHQLDSGMKDMDFPSLIKAHRDDILMRHGVPPLRAGIVETGALGGNVGQEQIRSYVENVVKPKQRRWSAFITQILRAWIDPRIEFEFNPIEIDQVATLALPLSTLFDRDLISRAEVRESLGKPDMDDGAAILSSELSATGEFAPDAKPVPGVTQ